MVSLLNDARITAGLPSLEFLNPWLYAEGFKSLNDIVDGSNPGCCMDSFKAITKGWDPVTGLGTPNFGRLKDLALSGTMKGDQTKGEDSTDGEKGSTIATLVLIAGFDLTSGAVYIPTGEILSARWTLSLFDSDASLIFYDVMLGRFFVNKKFPCIVFSSLVCLSPPSRFRVCTRPAEQG